MNLGHNEIASLECEGNSWIVTFRTMEGTIEAVFSNETDATDYYNKLN